MPKAKSGDVLRRFSARILDETGKSLMVRPSTIDYTVDPKGEGAPSGKAGDKILVEQMAEEAGFSWIYANDFAAFDPASPQRLSSLLTGCSGLT